MGDGGAEGKVQATGTERVLMAFKATGQDHISPTPPPVGVCGVAMGGGGGGGGGGGVGGGGGGGGGGGVVVVLSPRRRLVVSGDMLPAILSAAGGCY